MDLISPAFCVPETSLRRRRKMPSLARKVIIAAAVDGLLIQPLATKKEHKPSPPVRLRYGDAAISFVSRDGLPDLSKPNSSFEAFGVVGESAQQSLNHIP